MTRTHAWWEKGVIYQVYPRSFADTNEDGVGDLNGIVDKLDYLQWLGVDAVWLSPIYPSPMADFGYDVSDYTAIDPVFGTMDDFDRLLQEAHRRQIRIVLDYVPNHTSIAHPWFEESRSSRQSARRDWYIWKDPAPGGGPPNNWLSNFGGSAWALDERSGQYYYHAFLPEQPDLNWRNPAVRHAMADVLRFWLDRGVDGFRADVIWHLIKDEEFRDNPPNPEYTAGAPPHHQFKQTYNADQPAVHDVIAELRETIDAYPGSLLIGEVYLPARRLMAYYGAAGEGLHLPFNFHLLLADWTRNSIQEAIEEYLHHLPAHGWPNWVLGNHDRPRLASRVGTGQEQVAALLLLTLRGTPTLYYGDEIGMRDVPIPPDRVRDSAERRTPGLGLGRDPQRTPMQWNASLHAGFSRVEPWLPTARDAGTRNVAVQQHATTSLLSLYRKLLALRRVEPALSLGDQLELDGEGDVLSFVRRSGHSSFTILANFGSHPQTWSRAGSGTIQLSTYLDRGGPISGTVELRPNEGVIIRQHNETAPAEVARGTA